MFRSTTTLRNVCIRADLEHPGDYTSGRPVGLDDIVVWKLTLKPSWSHIYKKKIVGKNMSRFYRLFL